MSVATSYPPEAYAPNGVLWWKLKKHPGKNIKYGGARKTAAWLAFNVEASGTFRLRDVRRGIGPVPGEPNDDEQLDRRLRELREMGWLIRSYLVDRSLPADTYRVVRVGWHPGVDEERPRRTAGVSKRLVRVVLARDFSRCVHCGVAAGEPYPSEPGTFAVITAGHRIPARRGTRAGSADELQAECARCNSTVRDALPDPETLDEVLPDVKRLKRGERDELLRWLQAGHRLRSRLDDAYDRVRRLTPTEREVLIAELEEFADHG